MSAPEDNKNGNDNGDFMVTIIDPSDLSDLSDLSGASDTTGYAPEQSAEETVSQWQGIQSGEVTEPKDNDISHKGEPDRDNEQPCRIKIGLLCVITRQLATLLRAGMPLVPALSALVEQLEGQNIGRVIQEIAEHVNNGSSLAEALRRYPGIFSNLYVNMVMAGQAGGNLEDVLASLAETLERRARLTGRFRAAIAYPTVMAVTAVGVVFFLMAFVIPGIANIFDDMNRSLPRVTILLITASSFLRDYWLLIGLALGGTILASGAYLKTKAGKMKWDRLKLKLPLVGDLFLRIETARMAGTLGAMLSSGIPILDALEIVKGVIQNSFIAEAIDSIKQDIGRGHTIANAVRQTGLFPPIMVHTIAIGQMSGNLEEQLMNIAQSYDEETTRLVQSLTSLLEPAILLIMGLVVGFIVLAILLPIFEINQMI